MVVLGERTPGGLIGLLTGVIFLVGMLFAIPSMIRYLAHPVDVTAADMHELGITQEIVALAEARAGGRRVRRVCVEIGRLSAVLPDAVRFCFGLVAEGTAVEGAALDILETPGTARCRACGNVLELDRPFGRCACGGTDLDWLTGEELRVTAIDVDIEGTVMCVTCGCSEEDDAVVLTDLQTGKRFLMHDGHEHPLGDHEHGHEHDHGREHTHGHTHAPTGTIHLQEQILAKNSAAAERNRGWLDGRDVLALNLVSSPGSGKTTLLERTIRDLGGELSLAVIEGDQATANDAERIRATGCKVVQINTGTGCHLDAAMVGLGLKQLDPDAGSVVMIENVGNLVCPALFDLGERAKVVVVSVTEGEDKPVKYPHMFRASELMLLNKIDLLPYVTFDVGKCVAYARQVNPRLKVLQVSATRGDGLADWYDWVCAARA